MTAHTRRPHWILRRLRQLRVEAGLSLTGAEVGTGIPAIVIGSYERGDRAPSVHRVDELLHHYGYRLAVVPATSNGTRVEATAAAGDPQ